MQLEKSRQALKAAQAIIPGGVNSPVRAFRGVGGDPVFFDRGLGAYLYDVDGNKYIDYVGSWGPAILGHAHPEVLEAISVTMRKGLSFGAPTEGETRLAQEIRDLYPSMAMVRLVSSGTEACMTALRVARAYTRRDKILKFTGCYHGHADMLLVKAGSGALTLGLPDSPGVPADATKHTLVASYNDLDAVRQVFKANEGQMAAIILEPIVGNAGFIRPLPGFLEGLREITAAAGAMLIFDEVMTGCRVAPGGMQALTNITPDLTTLGKVIGGGLPLAAFGGRREVMEVVAPLGPMYQAGTLSGNPLAVAAGMKTLELLRRPQAFAHLTTRTARFVRELKSLAQDRGLPLTVDSEGGMFGVFFHPGPVRSLAEAQECNTDRFKRFFHAMLRRGIYLAPSAFEAGFVSMAHTDKDIERTLECCAEAFKELPT